MKEQWLEANLSCEVQYSAVLYMYNVQYSVYICIKRMLNLKCRRDSTIWLSKDWCSIRNEC